MNNKVKCVDYQSFCELVYYNVKWTALVVYLLACSCRVHKTVGSRSSQVKIKYYKIGICCFSVNHKGLRSKNKDWLTRNQNNVSEWSDMSTHRMLLQWDSAIKNPTKRIGLIVQIYAGFIIITSKSIFFSQWYSWKKNAH